MATTLYLRGTSTLTPGRRSHRGRGDNDQEGAATGWEQLSLLTVASDTAAAQYNRGTVAGPTGGLEPITNLGTYTPSLEWVSPPLAADVTISGTITFNLWAAESSMSANVAINARIDRIDETGAIVSTVITTARTTELGNTVPPTSAQNFTGSPSSTSFVKGDRIRVVIFGDDAGTMQSGYTFYLYVDGPSGFNGYSFITFTETLTFLETDPAGTTVYLTDSASGITDQGSTVDEKEAWTSRGSGVVSAARDSVAGYTNPLQWTTGSGGHTIEWYTRPLQAFTLSGLIKANIWNKQTNANEPLGCNLEIAVVNGDGSGAVVWSSGGEDYPGGEMEVTSTAKTWHLNGPDIDVTEGQRLRFRLGLDDAFDAMLASRVGTLYYAATSAGVSGDSYITFAETLTEFTGGGTISPSAIASAEAFGTPTIAKGNVNVQPSAISSAQVVGSHTLRPTNNIVVTGIASGQALGNPTIPLGTVTINPSAIASAEVFGTAALITGNVNIRPSAIASAEILGAHTLTITAPTQTVAPIGIDSAEAFGTAVLIHGGVSIAPTAIASSETFGTTTLVHGGVLVLSTSIASSESVGAPVLIKGAVVITPVAIGSTEAFGTTILIPGGVQITVTGIISQESVGNPTLAVSGGPSIIIASAIGSAEAVSTPALRATANVLPGAIASAEGFGTPTLHNSAIIAPAGIVSGEILGSPTLLPSAVTVQPSGIVSAEVVGTPVLISGAGVVLPAGIGSAESVGNPILIAGGVTIAPTAINSAQAFGASVLKPTAIIAPVAIASAEVFGNRTRLNPIQIPSISSAEAFGSPILVAGTPGVQTILPSAITSVETVGSPTLLHGNAVISSNAIASGEAFGAPSLVSTARIVPTTITSQEGVSQPVLRATASISPTSVGSGEALGQSTIRPGLVVISPQGVVSGEILGDPFISTGQIVVRPSSITSGELLGLPELIYFSAIIPEGLVSEEVFGFPELIPGVTFILPTAIDSAEMIGIPLLTGSRASWRWLNRAQNWVTTRGARDPDVQDGFARTRKDEGDT